ncbi:hypothetical protein Hanom_Chr04g00379981 [Helianthus anomalus]
MVPKEENNSLRFSSSIVSSKFFMYRFSPCDLSTASFILCSNLCFNSCSLSCFFCAFPTYHSLLSNF